MLISTSNQRTLAQIAGTDPSTLRLVSVSTQRQLDSVLRAAPSTAYHGVSIANVLVTAATARQLEHDHLWIQAWAVDSMQRADQLAAWGVNGITTDNLTILGSLAHGADLTSNNVQLRSL
ncbi:MAG: hypothetical protein JWM34_4322 [Ilumatobacteraceae bacterium]|nr:hypothetical protein [Ilumatobacteraceae bacterium]